MKCYDLHIDGVSKGRRTRSGRNRTSTGKTYATVVETMTNIIDKKGLEMESNQQQADEDQDEGGKHQHYYHPVIRTN